MSDPYENLANSIVLLAVKDYRDALKKTEKMAEKRGRPDNESRGGEVLPFCMV